MCMHRLSHLVLKNRLSGCCSVALILPPVEADSWAAEHRWDENMGAEGGEEDDIEGRAFSGNERRECWCRDETSSVTLIYINLQEHRKKYTC